MTSEKDVVLPALQVLGESLKGELSTMELRSAVKKRIKLSAEDRLPLMNRSDQRIDQIIRNLKSHKTSTGNPLHDGLLIDIPKGLRITEAGRKVTRRYK